MQQQNFTLELDSAVYVFDLESRRVVSKSADPPGKLQVTWPLHLLDNKFTGQ